MFDSFCVFFCVFFLSSFLQAVQRRPAAVHGTKAGARFLQASGVAGGSIFTVGPILTRGEKRGSENIVFVAL